ncbi:MAG: SecY interacting protein Syd [Paraglaciecola sp.]|jgi:SecY interacting protein Syd
MSQSVIEALDSFMQRFKHHGVTFPDIVTIGYDPKWPSECYQPSQDNEEGGTVSWQPVKRSPPANFSDLEHALELTIHPDIKDYYSRYWSENIYAYSEHGQLQLLQAWNEEDFALLQQNLVGHILMKRRLRQPETLFFALTSQDDFILSIDNQSGEVMLEQVGLQPEKTIAPNLAVFLSAIEPSDGPPSETDTRLP